VQVLVESTSHEELQCSTIVVPVVAEMCVDLSNDSVSVAASNSDVSMGVFFAIQALLLSSLTLLLILFLIYDWGMG
jgi:hypothetical protein